MLEVHRFVFNPIEENTYLVWCSETKECAIIDAGCRARHEKVKLKKKIEELGLKPTHLLNTHLHFDHIYGNKFIFETYNLLTEASDKDFMFIDRFLEQLVMFGMPEDEQAPNIGKNLKNGDEIKIGNCMLKVLATPGHSAGGLCFYSEKDNICFTGDTLFKGSIGRTDFPTGSARELMESIQGQLLNLPPQTRILPGHGEESTIEWERLNNVYIND